MALYLFGVVMLAVGFTLLRVERINLITGATSLPYLPVAVVLIVLGFASFGVARWAGKQRFIR
jgi:uncharacterized membrane protein YidH (DUF202 family)